MISCAMKATKLDERSDRYRLLNGHYVKCKVYIENWGQG